MLLKNMIKFKIICINPKMMIVRKILTMSKNCLKNQMKNIMNSKIKIFKSRILTQFKNNLKNLRKKKRQLLKIKIFKINKMLFKIHKIKIKLQQYKMKEKLKSILTIRKNNYFQNQLRKK